jgi:hypothetical protein
MRLPTTLRSTQKSLKAQASKETALGQGQSSVIWQWKNWQWLARSLRIEPDPFAVSKLISRGHHDPVSKDIATELFD